MIVLSGAMLLHLSSQLWQVQSVFRPKQPVTSRLQVDTIDRWTRAGLMPAMELLACHPTTAGKDRQVWLQLGLDASLGQGGCR